MSKTISSIKVVIEYNNGEKVSGEIDVNESFIPDLHIAIKNDKDPVDALSLLADIGSANQKTNPIAVKNRIG